MSTPQAIAVHQAHGQLRDIEANLAHGIDTQTIRNKVIKLCAYLRQAFPGNPEIDEIRADLDTLEVLHSYPMIADNAEAQTYDRVHRAVEALHVARTQPAGGGSREGEDKGNQGRDDVPDQNAPAIGLGHEDQRPAPAVPQDAPPEHT